MLNNKFLAQALTSNEVFEHGAPCSVAPWPIGEPVRGMELALPEVNLVALAAAAAGEQPTHSLVLHTGAVSPQGRPVLVAEVVHELPDCLQRNSHHVRDLAIQHVAGLNKANHWPNFAEKELQNMPEVEEHLSHESVVNIGEDLLQHSGVTMVTMTGKLADNILAMNGTTSTLTIGSNRKTRTRACVLLWALYMHGGGFNGILQLLAAPHALAQTYHGRDLKFWNALVSCCSFPQPSTPPLALADNDVRTSMQPSTPPELLRELKKRQLEEPTDLADDEETADRLEEQVKKRPTPPWRTPTGGAGEESSDNEETP